MDIERVERVERDDEEQVEQRQEKSPVGERIAKDTGCCLYSGISALVVMVVSFTNGTFIILISYIGAGNSRGITDRVS